MKTLLSTSILTLALVAGTNASATELGPISLTNTQMDTVDAGRYNRGNRARTRASANNGFDFARASGSAYSRRGTAVSLSIAGADVTGAAALSYSCAGPNC